MKINLALFPERIETFLKEFDEGKHQLTPEDEDALARSRPRLMAMLKASTRKRSLAVAHIKAAIEELNIVEKWIPTGQSAASITLRHRLQLALVSLGCGAE